MTILANLLAQKQKLLERLDEEPGPHERDEIVQLLSQIDAALDLLETGSPEPNGRSNES